MHIWKASSSLVSAKNKSNLCASRLLCNISQSVVSRKKNQFMCLKRTAWSKMKKLKNMHRRSQDQNVNGSLHYNARKLVSIKGRKEPLHKKIKWKILLLPVFVMDLLHCAAYVTHYLNHCPCHLSKWQRAEPGSDTTAWIYKSQLNLVKNETHNSEPVTVLEPFVVNKEFPQLEDATSPIFLWCLVWYERKSLCWLWRLSQPVQIQTHSGWTLREGMLPFQISLSVFCKRYCFDEVHIFINE